METTTNTAAIELLKAEIEINFIQRTDSPAKMALWKIKVSLLDELVKEEAA